MTLRRLLPCAIAVGALALPAGAAATFPGRNGKLAVTVQACDAEDARRSIAVIKPATGSMKQLTPPCRHRDGARAPIDRFAPEWFPDGLRLLFLDAEPRDPGRAPQVMSAAPGGGDEHALFDLDTSTASDAVGVTISPDGDRVAYERWAPTFTDRSIVTAGLDGGDVRVLPDERKCVDDQGTIHPGICDVLLEPRWSPDGKYLAVQRNGGLSSINSGIWLMDAETGRLIRRISRYGSDIDWSPDSRRVAFSSSPGGPIAGTHIFSVGIDGKGLRRVVGGERPFHSQPEWSPNGKWLAWVRIDRGRPGSSSQRPILASVWRRRVDTGRTERLARLPRPYVEGGDFNTPDLSWQSLSGPRPARRSG